MIRFAAILLIALALVVFVPGGFAQESDSHISINPAAAAYKRSAFLHGYAHGYEMGFHIGDLDLHMGRNAHDPKDFKEFKAAKKYYRSDFGDRDAFTAGYQQGFRVAYSDSYLGRDFRAAQEARTIAQLLRDNGAADQKPDRRFDQGLQDGYKQGLVQGLAAARNSDEFLEVPPACDAKTESSICLSRRLGYLLGYSDGYNNQRKPPTELKTASE